MKIKRIEIIISFAKGGVYELGTSTGIIARFLCGFILTFGLGPFYS
jgi:hypothetical protein